ncbi:MAG: hypothetical protein H0Z19_06300 [Archaeoglobus sp.]|uniref:TasA family protein n=1 Tax=Archaeoglobus sp. TaxID=1872626 RepID=UPI001E157587|nr:TasA family protein [Archaeoglobus sp.]MBO8180077.1 hypothetical protein [Archaeoglobus sp.]
MKNVWYSLLVVGLIGIGLGAGTIAYFSDTEMAPGTFTAGSLDLKVDLNSTYWKWDGNVYYHNFSEKDLGESDYFWQLDDVKPGDSGEMTVSLHLYDNPGYLWFMVDVKEDDDNGITEPESEAGDSTDGVGEGELDDYIYVMIWRDDDCDNKLDVYEDECECPICDGNGNGIESEQILWEGYLNEISDQSFNLSEHLPDGYMEPCETYCFGIYWSWDSTATDNMAQSDSWGADLKFAVTQLNDNSNPFAG